MLYRIAWRSLVTGTTGYRTGKYHEDEAQKYENWKTLGGKGWDYDKGCPK